jgi:hypothetical protein
VFPKELGDIRSDRRIASDVHRVRCPRSHRGRITLVSSLEHGHDELGCEGIVSTAAIVASG